MSSSLQGKKSGVLITREAWYRNPTFVWILKSAAINFILPFFNGVMMGFGEILANEVIFKYGWFGYSRPQLGINAIPPSATREYKAAINAEIKREEKELLLVD
jgi:hypothetical protein